MGKPEGPSIEGQSTLWPEASPDGENHARTSARRAKARASSTASGPASGERCIASSPSADRLGFWLRTCLLCELAELTGYSLIWARWATPACRSWWVLGRSERRTDAIEFGSSEDWATPTAVQAGGTAEMFIARKMRSIGNDSLTDLQMQVIENAKGTWPTPDTVLRKSHKAMTASRDNGRRSGGGNSSPPGLEQVAEIAAGIRPRELPNDENLPPATKAMLAWPTPCSRDWKNDGHCPAAHARKSPGLPAATYLAGQPDQASRSTSGKSQDLSSSDREWMTPKAGDSAGAANRSTTGRPIEKSTHLTTQVFQAWPTPKSADGRAKGNSGVLNSRWVAQLQGYPPDWCDLPSDVTARLFARTATQSSRKSSKRSEGR